MMKGITALMPVLVFCMPGYAQAPQLGRSVNAFTAIRPQQTQVYASQELNTIVFIHRQDPVLSGEDNNSGGKLRYDLSTDGGMSWTKNIGVLNENYTRTARHPDIAIYNPAGNTDPSGAFLVWQAPTLSGSNNFDGHVNGTAPLTVTAPSSTENYQFANTNSGIPGSLTERIDGEFWSVEIALVGDSATDTAFVYKGTWNGTDNVDWVRSHTLPIDFSTSFDLRVHASGPSIAFSPDGQTGYIGLVADINTADTIYNVTYARTTDGGATWGPWTEVNPNSVPGLLDSARIFTIPNPQGNALIVSSVTTSYDFDMTVDINGNPHFFTSVLAGEVRDENTDSVVSPKAYKVYVALPKFAWDITSPDGGATWTGNFVAPLNAFQTEIVSADDLEIYNYPQVARTEDGSVIFFSWADTDTLVTGPTFSNINPNVRVAGYRISDGYRTCNKRIEAAEISIGDRMMTPAMAPVVLENINGSDYTLPIVVMDILSDGDNPVNFYYIGQLAVFCNPEFVDPSTLNLRWQFGNGCYDSLPCTLGLDAPSTDIRFFVYPNPAEDQLNFVLQSGEAIHEVYVTNLLGETVQTVNRENLLLSGEPNTINTHHLPNGIYLLNMQTAYGLYGQKFVVNK